MDDIDALLLLRVSKPAGIVSGEVPVWNGSTWVRSSATPISSNSGPTFSSWAPALVQGVGVSFTTGYARLWQFGKLVTVIASLLPTSAGTAGQPITISGLPAAPSGQGPQGVFLYLSQGVAFYQGAIMSASTSSFTGQAHGLGSSIGQTPNFAVKSTDQLWMQATYEAA